METKKESMKKNRPSWDEYWMKMAEVAITRSTCIRRQVGAVAVKDNWLLAIGYNGAPSGIKHCGNDCECLRVKLKIPSGERAEICRAVHAEQNIIIQAAKYGASLDGATLYVTVTPCFICAKMLINTGIKEIVCKGKYPDNMSEIMLKEAGINVRFID